MSEAERASSRRTGDALPAAPGTLSERRGQCLGLTEQGAAEASISIATHPKHQVAGIDIIDLDNHPDGQLLRWISEAGRLRSAAGADGVRLQTGQDYYRVYGKDAGYVAQLDEMIRRTAPQGEFALHAKAMWALEGSPRDRLPSGEYGNLVAVIRDFMKVRSI